MNKQWMALLLSAGMAVTTCPVPGAQEPPAEPVSYTHLRAHET